MSGLNLDEDGGNGGSGGDGVTVVGRIKVRLRVSELPLIPSEPIEPPDPFNIDLTERGLRGLSFTPLVAGDNWAIRVQVRTPDDVAAINLTGFFLMATVVRRSRAVVLLTRRSDTAIAPGLFQIQSDDQTTDTGSAGAIGRGWLQINGHSSEQTLMENAVGINDLDLRGNASGAVLTILRGRIEMLLPRTEEVA